MLDPGAEEVWEALKICLQHLEHPRRVERRGWMEDREEQHLVPTQDDLLGAAVDAGNPVGLAGQQLGGEVAERRDDLGADELDLLEEVRLAGLQLTWERVAVARGTAFHRVRDIDHLASHADALEELRKQFSSGSDERDALLVLVEAGRFADEHQVG